MPTVKSTEAARISEVLHKLDRDADPKDYRLLYFSAYLKAVQGNHILTGEVNGKRVEYTLSIHMEKGVPARLAVVHPDAVFVGIAHKNSLQRLRLVNNRWVVGEVHSYGSFYG